MSEYLRTHPQILMSYPKEPAFLADDLPEMHLVHSMKAYLKMYEGATEHHRAIGEASVWYLYSTIAQENILKLNPDAKVIVMFRNPIDFLQSYHAQLLSNLDEVESDFDAAWSLQETRAAGDKIPSTCRMPLLLQYEKIAKFGHLLEQVHDLFPAENIKCAFFDDLKEDPRAVYQDILAFLELDDDGLDDFPQFNKSNKHRSKLLTQLILAPPAWLKSLWRAVKRVLGTSATRFTSQVVLWNSYDEKSKPLSTSMRRYLADVYRQDIMKLEKMTGRDLARWYEVSDTTSEISGIL